MVSKVCGAVLGMVALLVAGSPAFAQWAYTQSEDDPFAGGAQHMAGTISTLGEWLMFRCTGADDLALLYVTVEQPSPEHRAVIKLLPVQVSVIVDDEPKRSFDAEVDTTPDGKRYRVTAAEQGLSDVVKLAASAKRRFAMAVELGGQRMYSAAVNVRGSRSALGQLKAACKLP